MASENITSGQYERTKAKRSKTPPYQIILKRGEPEYLQILPDETSDHKDTEGYLVPLGATSHGDSDTEGYLEPVGVTPHGESDTKGYLKPVGVTSHGESDTEGYLKPVGVTSHDESDTEGYLKPVGLTYHGESDTEGYLVPVSYTTHGESSNAIPLGEYLTTDGTASDELLNVHYSDNTHTGGYYQTVDDTTDSQAKNEFHAGDRRLMSLPSLPVDTEVYEEIPDVVYPKSKSKRAFVIVGVTIGVLVLIGIVIWLVFFLLQRKSKQEITSSQMTVSTMSPQQSSPSETVCGMQADVLFAIDSSGSIKDHNPGNWYYVLQFVESFVMSNQILVGPDDVRIAAMVYGNDAYVKLNFSETLTRHEVANRVRSIQYFGGNTNTAAALEKARTTVFTETNGDRSSAGDITILISDGVPTIRVTDTLDQAEQLKRAGVFIITIGITEWVDENLLRNISSNNQLLNVEDFYQLSTILDPFISATCISDSRLK